MDESKVENTLTFQRLVNSEFNNEKRRERNKRQKFNFFVLGKC